MKLGQTSCEYMMISQKSSHKTSRAVATGRHERDDPDTPRCLSPIQYFVLNHCIILPIEKIEQDSLA